MRAPWTFVKKVTNVISGSATAVWANTTNLSDKPSHLLLFVDRTNLSDSFRSTLALPDKANLSDLYSSTTTAAKAAPETVRTTDVFTCTISALEDNLDGWTNQASPTTVEPNTSPLHISQATGATSSSNNEQDAFLAWDMSKIANLSWRSGTNQMTLHYSNAGLTAVSATVEIRSGTTAPFSETTLNWNNQPTAYGTQRLAPQTVSLSASTTNGAVSVTLSQTVLNACITDGWMLVIVRPPAWVTGTLVAAAATILSREDPSLYPILVLTLTR